MSKIKPAVKPENKFLLEICSNGKSRTTGIDDWILMNEYLWNRFARFYHAFPLSG